MSAELGDRVVVWPHPEPDVGDEGWLEKTGPGVWNGARGGVGGPWHEAPERPAKGLQPGGAAGWGSKDGGRAGEGRGGGIWLAPCLSPSGVGLRTGVAAGLGLEHWSSNLLCTFSPYR